MLNGMGTHVHLELRGRVLLSIGKEIQDMMFRKPRSKIVSGILAGTVLIAGALLAQQPSGKTGHQGSSMNMGDMMKQCKDHCQRATTAIDQTRKDIETAEQSNDPAKMRAALEQTDKRLSEMSEHMNSCMSMMSMMQNMQGMESGGKKQ